MFQMYLDTQIDRNRDRIENCEEWQAKIMDRLTALENQGTESAVLVLTIDEDFIQELDKLREDNQYMQDYIQGFSRLLEDKYQFKAHQERWEK